MSDRSGESTPARAVGEQTEPTTSAEPGVETGEATQPPVAQVPAGWMPTTGYV